MAVYGRCASEDLEPDVAIVICIHPLGGITADETSGEATWIDHRKICIVAMKRGDKQRKELQLGSCTPCFPTVKFR